MSQYTDDDETPELPAPSLWPIGFAIGLACLLVGLVVSTVALVIGIVLSLVFGVLWVRDVSGRRASAPPDPEPAAAPAPAGLEPAPATYDRSMFLSAATLGVGGVIGGIVTLPVLGFAVLPSFESEGTPDIDLGPISNFPEGTFVIATYEQRPRVNADDTNSGQGEVSRRTAYVRNNGLTEDGVPSFTVLFSRCVHLGCPVQPNGPFQGDPVQYEGEGRPSVSLQPVLAASFGCPCHGGLYDSEGNRTAGPPVRSLDRYAFSIRDGNLILNELYSVGEVDGTGARARISRYEVAAPGVHVDGLEKWLYPLPVPGK